MIIFQILLIVLVAAPVIALAVYLYMQIAAYVRKKNLRDEKKNPGTGRKNRKSRKRR